jgi:hypothetical protein
MSQYLPVPKGTRISIETSFHCANENLIVVKDYSNGVEVLNSNSHMNSNRHWESPVNVNDTPTIYELRGYHKNTPPDGGEPWYESVERVIFANPVTKVVGYEDAGDNDFNDAVATVTWRR